MRLSHPDLDLIIVVLTLAPCLYYGVMEGIRRGVQKPRKLRPATHPFRRQGDKYAYYFYIAYRYCGPNSLIGSIPRIGSLPCGILAALALKLVVTKGEQYSYARSKKEVS